MHWEPFLSPPPAGKASTNSKCCRMWFPFTDICLLVGTLKVCWDQEIADYPLQRTNPFKPFRNSPAHVDHSVFLSGQAKLVLGLVKKRWRKLLRGRCHKRWAIWSGYTHQQAGLSPRLSSKYPWGCRNSRSGPRSTAPPTSDRKHPLSKWKLLFSCSSVSTLTPQR